MRKTDCAISIEHGTAIEPAHRPGEAQFFSQPQHAARRPRTDQRHRHTVGHQRANRSMIGIGKRLVVAHQRTVDIGHQKTNFGAHV